MNCDQAFDRLTSSESLQSPELLAHLDSCPRCRHMQEVLAPALELFDSVSTESDPASPCTSSRPAFLSVESVRVAEAAARRLTATVPLQANQWKRLVKLGLQYAAVLSLGIVVALGTIESRQARDSHFQVAPTELGQHCTRVEVAQLTHNDAPLAARNVVLSCVACHLAH